MSLLVIYIHEVIAAAHLHRDSAGRLLHDDPLDDVVVGLDVGARVALHAGVLGVDDERAVHHAVRARCGDIM